METRGQSTPKFRLRTLGAQGLLRDDGTTVLGPGVPLSILTYLHAAPRRAARREQLAGTFWGGSDQSLARQALRKNLSRLRDLLGESAFEDSDGELRLSCPVESDRDDFLSALERGDWPTVSSVYAGPFFPESGTQGAVDFEHWVDTERERLRRLFVRAGEKQVREHIDRARPAEALEVARRLRTEASDSEPVRRLVLEALIAARDHEAASDEAANILRWLTEEDRGPEPATAHLLSLAAADGPPAPTDSAPLAVEPEMVGREREFHSIVAAWRDVVSGPVRILAIEGPAGFGKTRLLKEVEARIKTLAGRVIYSRAAPGDREVPWSFAAGLVQDLCELAGAKAISGQSAELLVGLNSALGSTFPNVQANPGGEDRLQQRALALVDLLGSLAEEAPLALLLDDFHWVDSESRSCISSALGRFSGRHFLCAAASRSGGLKPAVGESVQRILLPPLTLADTEGLLASIGAFGDAATGRRLAAALHRSTSGSPMYMVDAIRAAVGEGRLVRHEGRWEVPDSENMVAWLGERRSLDTRLASLTDRARGLLLTMAATGAPLARQDLERAVGSGVFAGNTLSELEHTGYLAVRGERWDLANYDVAEALLRMAPENDREAAHAALGGALLVRAGGDPLLIRRAVRHLIHGKANVELARLFRLEAMETRKRGDWTAAAILAREFLGELATESRVTALVRQLPRATRWRLMPFAVMTIVALAALVLILVLA